MELDPWREKQVGRVLVTVDHLGWPRNQRLLGWFGLVAVAAATTTGLFFALRAAADRGIATHAWLVFGLIPAVAMSYGWALFGSAQHPRDRVARLLRSSIPTAEARDKDWPPYPPHPNWEPPPWRDDDRPS